MISHHLTPVHVYELPDRLFVHSMVRTEAGFLLAVEPALRLPLQASDEELGAAAQTLLKSPLRTVPTPARTERSEEHTSELQSRLHLVCRLLLEKKKTKKQHPTYQHI